MAIFDPFAVPPKCLFNKVCKNPPLWGLNRCREHFVAEKKMEKKSLEERILDLEIAQAQNVGHQHVENMVFG